MRARTTNPISPEAFKQPDRLVVVQDAIHPPVRLPLSSEERIAEYFGPHGELLRQANVARALGSPFVASVLEAGHRQIQRAPRTAALIADWPGDPAAAAMAMRFNAALHALARRHTLPELSALYRDQQGDFDGTIAMALAAKDDFIAEWMRIPPQTNEVGRAATILAGLMVLHGETGGLPFELLEIGSSTGLNLNLARYAYYLGGVSAGEQESPVRIAPKWLGPPPPYAPVEIAAAQGVDLQPLDPADAAVRERLLSYIWADEPARAERLQQALNMARRYPPQIERDNAVNWIARQLRRPQQAGRCRTVFHSMVLQYLDAQDRQSVVDTIMAAGARATSDRPFAWISFEWTAARSEVQLMLTSWPNGETRQLATCHPYGVWIHWRG